MFVNFRYAFYERLNFYFFSILQPPFNPKINQARATVPIAKIVSPITLSHFNVNIAG